MVSIKSKHSDQIGETKQITTTKAYDPENAQKNDGLAHGGYAQEMKRNLGLTTILGLSFSIIAAPFGISTAFSIALINGGACEIFWGWFLVSIISIFMSSSLAEISSVWPSAGGVYLWSYYLSPPKYRVLASWVTGWVNLVANLTLCLSIVFGGSQLIMSAISIFRNNEWSPEPYQTVLCFFACMLIAALVNVWGVKGNYLELLNTASMYWTSASVLIIMVTILVKAPSKRSAEYVFTSFENTSGWPDGGAFIVGLLQAAYTITGYGTLASMADEVNNPERAVPRAMVGSVLAASLTGFVYIIPILFVLPDISVLLDAAAGQPIPVLFLLVTGSRAGGFGLLFLILGIFAFAAVGSLTVALRCMWSFSRDGAIPGSSWLKKVNKSLDLPLNSLIATTVLVSLLGLISLGSTAAFSAFTGTATICLGFSYGVPIAFSLLEKRKQMKGAPFSLGKFGFFINILTLCWILLSAVIFCMPTAVDGLTASSMNYASVVFMFFFATSAAYYFAWGKKYFKGPQTQIHEEDRIVEENLNVDSLNSNEKVRLD